MTCTGCLTDLLDVSPSKVSVVVIIIDSVLIKLQLHSIPCIYSDACTW